MWKWVGLLFTKNYLLRCWDWFPLLNWIDALIFIAKTTSKKNGALIRSMKFLSPEVAQVHENVHVPYKNAETNPRINFVHLDIFW